MRRCDSKQKKVCKKKKFTIRIESPEFSIEEKGVTKVETDEWLDFVTPIIVVFYDKDIPKQIPLKDGTTITFTEEHEDEPITEEPVNEP